MIRSCNLNKVDKRFLGCCFVGGSAGWGSTCLSLPHRYTNSSPSEHLAPDGLEPLEMRYGDQDTDLPDFNPTFITGLRARILSFLYRKVICDFSVACSIRYIRLF